MSADERHELEQAISKSNLQLHAYLSFWHRAGSQVLAAAVRQWPETSKADTRTLLPDIQNEQRSLAQDRLL